MEQAPRWHHLQLLRERFETLEKESKIQAIYEASWYGPLAKFFGELSPHNVLVKPQAQLRQEASEAEVSDPDASIESIDSYGRNVKSGPRKYPDFIISTFTGRLDRDIMLLIVEVKRTGGIDEAVMDLLGYLEFANRPPGVLGLAVAGFATKIIRPHAQAANGYRVEQGVELVSDEFWDWYRNFMALHALPR